MSILQYLLACVLIVVTLAFAPLAMFGLIGLTTNLVAVWLLLAL